MARPTENVTTWVADLKTIPGGSLSQLGLHNNTGISESYRVCRAALQKAVFSEVTISTLCHPDGVVYPCPDGVEDDVLDAQFREQRFAGVPIDLLVTRALSLVMNECDADAASQFRTLRLRLLRALEAVDVQLAELNGKMRATQ